MSGNMPSIKNVIPSVSKKVLFLAWQGWITKIWELKLSRLAILVLLSLQPAAPCQAKNKNPLLGKNYKFAFISLHAYTSKIANIKQKRLLHAVPTDTPPTLGIGR